MKKIICIILIILIAIMIVGMIFFFKIFGNNKYDLNNISENQRLEIIALLNCSEISNEINLIKIQIPKVYRDIYYEIYFKTDNKNIKDYVSKSEYETDLKELKSNNYCCIIYNKDDKNIDILETLINEK